MIKKLKEKGLEALRAKGALEAGEEAEQNVFAGFNYPGMNQGEDQFWGFLTHFERKRRGQGGGRQNLELYLAPKDTERGMEEEIGRRR
jgi:hypothetical protein